ncbi:hypothetical protein AB0873_20860 [Micromonospora sp. NPDC047707]|uniref:hypothetical protein n=1 Tax=unclassified Micromonospora TaxID=2617518 RepID=UPI0012B46139|nr:hypothetical protein [Micromonospora sp. WMMC415]QGN49593.1 hypothetical protein GKC29_23995 [Micromonospora sp. WMMC415]
MRLRFWRCKPTVPSLPRRIRGANLPAALFAPTRPIPTVQPGRAGSLTRAQEYRANGGRW